MRFSVPFCYVVVNYLWECLLLRSPCLSSLVFFLITKIVRHAVMGMLPKNSLRKRMVTKLLIYPGPSHPHEDKLPADSTQSLLERTERIIADKRPMELRKNQDETYVEWP